MTSLIQRDKDEARKKGMFAIGAWGGAAFLLSIGWTFTGAAAIGGAAVLTWRWFMFRAKRGMRF
jgi:hypothetical protein